MPEELRKYNDFFAVDESYCPEITPNSIKEDAEGWMHTWPHTTFVELLEKTERMLAREARGKRHCIWVQGAFGTGKSRVIWTLRELLTCSEEKFNTYFNEFDALKAKPDLKAKLLAHKRGRVVTAFRYSSGDITDTRKLIMAVYESVSEALKQAHCEDYGLRTIRGQIAEWLEDAGNQQIFQIMMNKPNYRNRGSFNGKTPVDILNKLRSSDNADALINDILDISERERIGVYDLSIDDLKNWLTDVIDSNHLTALVLIWDEFSGYFKQNLNALDQLQSLVELCANKPFEMVIVTHEIGALDRSGENVQLKTIRDRFEEVNIQMPDNVAFELIGHAMKPNEAAHETWEMYQDDIAGRSTESRMVVARAVGVEDSVLRKMTPIHPMAALMLKYISERFASNQRSMFNFIKNDETDDLHAFQWFISTHTPENPDILTIDYLWDFFYEKGRDEHGSGSGRSNLDMLIAGILDSYPQYEQRLNEEQRRVLKAVLMMQAVSRRINNAISLLRPTENNIKLAFEGDDSFSTSPALILKNQLVTQLKILFASPAENNVVEYATAMVQGDQQKIDEIIARIRNEAKTGKLLRDAQLDSAILMTASEKMRFRFTPVTIDDFTRITNQLVDRVTARDGDYHIYGVVCFAKDELEQARIQSLITDARCDEQKKKIVIIDASVVPMGAARFLEWAKYAGNEEYWRPKDPDLADNHKRNLNAILNEWKTGIQTENLLVYYGDHFERTPGGVRSIRDKILPEIVLDRYPLSFDNAAVSDNFFHADRLPDGAKKGIKRETGGIYLNGDVMGMLRNVWRVPDYWMQPSLRTLPISQLKQQLTELIETRFLTDVRISHTEIYAFLVDHGFMPCNLYSFLAGFLLSEYAGAPYRYGIGESGDEGDTQNTDKLGEHIGECFKYKNQDLPPIRNYKEKYIEIMSPEQKAFVDFVHDAFGVPENSSVERAASKMRTKLKELGYPVWCYKVIDRCNLEGYLDRIAEIANDRGGGNVPAIAKRLGKMLLDIRASSGQLIALLTPEHGAEALREFLEDYRNRELLNLAEEIGAPDPVEDVRNALSSGEYLWLWDQETGEKEINNLIVEYQIVAASNAFAGYATFEVSHDYATCMTKWKECARNTHIPSAVIQEKLPDLRQWALLLREILTDGSLPIPEKKEAFLNTITNNKAEILVFLSNRAIRFTEFFASSLHGLDAEIGKRIYLGLPNSSFIDSKSDFIRRVNDAADRERASQQITLLRTTWRTYAGFDNAHLWSDHYRTPVLAMVPAQDHEQAKRLFSTLRNNSASDADIRASQAFLDSQPAFLYKLKDQGAIDKAFIRELIGLYRSLVTVEEAREVLSNRIPASPYEWMTGNAARAVIRETAENHYLSGANQALLDRIDQMDDAQAKKYLKQLVQDKLDVGVQMMDSEGMLP